MCHKLRRRSHGQWAAPFEGSLISERLSMLDESFTLVKLHLSTHVSVCTFVAQPLSVSVQMEIFTRCWSHGQQSKPTDVRSASNASHSCLKSKRVMSWLAPLEKHWLGFVQLLRHTSRHVSFVDNLFCKYAPQSRARHKL